ncbi:hypothetical protein PCANC_15843 [Puccinia coronata f. sp. avenae]|uniref:Uncharacterized protein n=1 Tax=Puccinia coronata f. sp. avenae TaxID=200324 RepID=A0A2N5SQR3_9BASI|nr:hypothetical protein PCANC_15843 [Puccinia coronata f. sp. avenae]
MSHINVNDKSHSIHNSAVNTPGHPPASTHPTSTRSYHHPPSSFFSPIPPPFRPTGRKISIIVSPPLLSSPLSIIMVFCRYDASIKIVTVCMTLQRHSQHFICNSLGATISRQSFEQWTQLFHETQRVVRDPEEYAARGRRFLLSAEDREFMIELVLQEPSLFLDEMRKRLYDNTSTLISISSLHDILVEKLSITLKKPDTVNIGKSLTAKYCYISKMANVPAEFLVFTGVVELPFDIRGKQMLVASA